jgi:hypothetical protein
MFKFYKNGVYVETLTMSLVLARWVLMQLNEEYDETWTAAAYTTDKNAPTFVFG